MSTERFTHLYKKYLHKTYTTAEKEEFLALLREPENRELLHQLSDTYNIPHNNAPLLNDAAGNEILQAILHTQPKAKVRNLRPWLAAASVLALLATGIYFYRPTKTSVPPVVHTMKEVAPGHEGAVLTLANGQHVVLDSLQQGVVAMQAGTQVSLQNGQLTYNAGDSKTVVYNTIHTPKGRQFSLLLPDGSKVWLNAASSLRYPTAFNGTERKVEVSGEAYFEIAKNASQPFRVAVQGAHVIEVLGTSFNVNAYTDEAQISTTLLEGSVRIGKTVLQPGQQAQSSNGTITVKDHVNTEQVLAWKNGVFDFNNKDLAEVMRQLARWYNIEVVYENGVPDKEFVGKLDRSLPLSAVLKAFEDFGVHSRMETGTRLVILP